MLCLLLGALFVLQLVVHAATSSATTDEAVHLMAGQRHLQCSDYAFNPEHPPLLKQLAALPLQSMAIQMPDTLPCDVGFTPKTDTFKLGELFLIDNGGDRVLIPARLFAMQFAVLLALLMGIAAWRVFGAWPAAAVMGLLATEPVLVAHGSLVTTDMAITATMFLSVMVLYASREWAAWRRVLAMGLAFGLMLASKHSALLILPLLALLYVLDRGWWHAGRWQAGSHLVRPALEFSAAGVLAVGLLWAVYGFRYSAAPGMAHTVALHTFLGSVGKPGAESLTAASVLPWLYRAGLLPEAYLMGLTDIIGTSVRNTRVLGQFYEQGQWFYYPIAFSLKSTVGLLVLLPIGIGSMWLDRGRRRLLLFLLLPSAGYFAIGMSSSFTSGIRHVLQVYPYCVMLAGFAVATLWRRGAPWRWLVVVLLGYQALTMVRTAPDYIPFANAFWGGPSRAYWVLPFDNADWDQTPKRLATYINGHGVRTCWFSGLVHPRRSTGIPPCKQLPDGRAWRSRAVEVEAMPRVLDGTIFLAVRITSPREGPTFRPLLEREHEMVAGAVLAYHGRFDLPGVAGLSHAMVADQLVRANRFDDAIHAGGRAVALAGNDPRAWISYGDALFAAGRVEEAKVAVVRARDELERDRQSYAFFAEERLRELQRRLAEGA